MIEKKEHLKRQLQTSLTIKLEEINQKILAKESKLIRYRDKFKQYKQNRTFQYNEWKFYQQVGGECIKTNQQPNAKETKPF